MHDFLVYHPSNLRNIRKKILVKIFAGFVWEGRLVEFVDIFTKRREELELALAVHTAVGVDVANLKLDTVQQQNEELTRRYIVPLHIWNVDMLTICIRMDVMLGLFKEFVTPQQKKLAAMVGSVGGDAALEDEQAMEELCREASALTTTHPGTRSRRNENYPFNLAELQQEINDNPDDAIKKNAESFSRIFDVQKRQIVEDVTRVVIQETDRIILAIEKGPHVRIIDPVQHHHFRFCASPSSLAIPGYPRPVEGNGKRS